MFDPALDRLLAYRAGVVADCWGQRRDVHHGNRNRIWFLDPLGLDEPIVAAPSSADDVRAFRREMLAAFAASGQFTKIELATLEALVIDQLTIGEIAERDGCSRQAIVARIVGNSRGQGGILKKASAFRDRGKM